LRGIAAAAGCDGRNRRNDQRFPSHVDTPGRCLRV
jgi:hypothetical protein